MRVQQVCCGCYEYRTAPVAVAMGAVERHAYFLASGAGSITSAMATTKLAST